MDEETGGDPQATITEEVRTRRLVVVDSADRPVATLQVQDGVVELSIGSTRSGQPCTVVAYAGEPEAGHYTAGVELWVGGTSIGGISVTRIGEVTGFDQFGPRRHT